MFREYDIRGRETPDELNPTSARAIGMGYGEFLRRRNIHAAVVGRDSRTSSDELAAAFIDGLTETGCDVIDIGLCTTPMVYWAQFHFQMKGAAAITASHNPAGWNGVKLAVDLARTMNRSEVEELYSIISDESWRLSPGTVRLDQVADAYVQDLVGRTHLKSRPRILLNTGNGTAGFIAPRVFREAGCDVVELHTDIDPTYPFYPANPSIVEMMTDTGDHVRSSHSEIGIALDADADRLGITDELGATLWPDLYMIPIVKDFLAKTPGAKIVFDVKCSQALIDVIESAGGVPVMCKTGHSFVKEKTKEVGAVLAVEASGHIFVVGGYYGFDDGVFAGLKLVEYLSVHGLSMAEAIADAPRYYASPVLNAACPDEEKYRVAAELVERFKKDGYRVIELSGARVEFGDGWGLVRASSNLPQLVLRFEGRTPERLEQIQSLFRGMLAEYETVSQDWHSG